jgi:hypothetical protein
MSEMKKTAVDVLIHKIHQELDWFYPKVKLSQKLIDETKAMEKEQIISFAAWYSGMEKEKVQRAYNRYLNETTSKSE